MKRALAAAVASLLVACPKGQPAVTGLKPDLSCSGPMPFNQWGQDPSHSSTTCNQGQALARVLADVVYDPFTAQEEAESGGDLLAHYQAPLVDGDEVFMSAKWGTYVSCNPPASGAAGCGPNAWNAQTWGVQKHRWQAGALAKAWNFESDWKPEPNGGTLSGWEPVFHAALTADSVWVPGAGGSVFQLSRATGSVVKRLQPFGATLDANTYVAGPLTVDAQGRVLYNALKLDAAKPWSIDAPGAWLVRVGADGKVESAPFSSLVAGAPKGGDLCNNAFPNPKQGEPALPPPDDSSGQPAKPPTIACGSQRPGINVAPAVGADGTIFTVSRAHFASRYGY